MKPSSSKSSSNKETPKIIALVVLGVAAVGVGVTQFIMPQGAKAGAPVPSPSPSASPAATVSASGAASPDTASEVGPVPMSRIQLQTNGRDPFVPSGTAAATTVARASFTPPPPPQRPVPPIPGISKGGELSRGFGSPTQRIDDIVFNKSRGGGIRPVGEGGTPALTVAPPTPPAYTVTGVVLGDRGGRDVAILRGGGGAGQEERRFVTVGEDVGSGFYVASIHANGITLRSRTHSSLGPVALDLGKTE